MSDMFEFIDAEYAAPTQNETRYPRGAVDRADVRVDWGVPVGVLRLAEQAGVGHGPPA